MKATASFAASALLGLCGPSQAAEWSLLARNYLLHSDSHEPAERLRQEWAQGFIVSARTELFERGELRLGGEVHGFLGLKLDGGRGHAGTGLLPLDSADAAEDDYSSAGGALHLSWGDSRLKYGEMTVATPLLATGDKRLQPEYASGWLLDSQVARGLSLQAGRFTAFKNQDASSGHSDFSGYGASTRHEGLSLAGLRIDESGESLSGAVYAGRLDDTWSQLYANLNAHSGNWTLDANLYRTRDSGSARAGAIDTLAHSLLGSLQLGGHRVSLGYQKVDGDTPFDFVGGDSIYLANSAKYADFNGPGERSWQVRYQWVSAVLPGLSLTARYVRGDGIDGSAAPSGGAYHDLYGQGGRHWERDLDLRYVVQTGAARDLSVSLAHVAHRANIAQGGADLDRIYLIVEYPLAGGF